MHGILNLVNFNIVGKNLTPEMLRKSYNFKREACRIVVITKTT